MKDKMAEEYSFGREARKVINDQTAYEEKPRKIKLIIDSVKTEISKLPETDSCRIKISEIIACAERDLEEEGLIFAIKDLETSEDLLNLRERA